MYKNNKIVALIPARAGSTSIHNKNLQVLGSHSLLGRSIKHAQDSRLLDGVFVSTNGPEIKEEALSYRVGIIDRPDNISGPKSPTEECMLHFVNQVSCDYVVVLQPTSPFRRKGLIDFTIQAIIDDDADSLLTVWKFHDFCFYYDSENNRQSTYDYVNRPMRQSLPIQMWKYFDNGCIYITKTEFLKESKCRLGGRLITYPVSFMETIQIDEMEDLSDCRQLIKSGDL